MDTTETSVGFDALGLSPVIAQAVLDLGYETPTAIQSQCIPHLLAGRDLLGQAQTGTGKTAAFALPLLSRIDPELRRPQILVLTPTRELALQVAEAFQGYARNLKNFHVLPIYGGQAYGLQLSQLKRNPQVIVGTPGRVMDHIRRGTLSLEGIKTLVLDEADEMLNMGFAEDIDWIFEQAPKERQVALFSATMPPAIRRVAQDRLSRSGRGANCLGLRDRRHHRPASLRRDALPQARHPHAHPGAGAVRRHADLRAHQECDHRADRQAQGPRLRRRAAERRHESGDARAHGGAPQAGPVGHSGRHRRGRARSGRGAHQPCRQLRHPDRSVRLRASHRPDWPSGPRRAGHPAGRAARARSACGPSSGPFGATFRRWILPPPPP